MERINIKKIIASLSLSLFTIVSYGENYVFKSYHIYTSDDDKYLETNVQNDNSKICIEETNQDIEFSLYNHEADKWMSFNVKINYKVDLGFKAKIGTLYVCTNNANQTCSVSIIKTDEGTFIDLHHFFVGEQALSCWVKSEKKQ